MLINAIYLANQRQTAESLLMIIIYIYTHYVHAASAPAASSLSPRLPLGLWSPAARSLAQPPAQGFVCLSVPSMPMAVTEGPILAGKGLMRAEVGEAF